MMPYSIHGQGGQNERGNKMTAKKFSNLVAKTLGITHGPAVGQEARRSAARFQRAYIKHEIDGAFMIAYLPNWQAAKLLEAGFTATAKLSPKGWFSDEQRVELYWTAA
jgi:hypothetical protein